MTPSPHPVDPSALLANSKWMRALAAQLVQGDPSVADDLVQETLLAALQRQVPPSRAWIGAVMRNLARLRFRSQARRRDREVFANEWREVPSPSELTARIELQRQIAEAVLRIREPYRETVLLRFNEDMAPQEIAEHLGLSPGTVRSRLKRGLDLLREDLDARHGSDGRSWALALLPLIDRPLVPSPPPLPGVLTPSLLALSAGGLVIWLVTSLLLQGDLATPTDRIARSGPNAAPETSLPRSSAPGSQRTRVVDSPGGLATVEVDAIRASGWIYDAEGHPLASVGIGFIPNGEQGQKLQAIPVGQSDARGHFELELPHRSGVLQVTDPLWTTLLDSSFWPDFREREAVLVAAPSQSFSATLLDELGQPIEGASLTYKLPEEFRRNFPRSLSTTNRSRRTLRSDGQGRASWSTIPRVEGAHLWVRAQGYLTRRVELPAGDVHELPILLSPRTSHSNRQRAWVVNSKGQGVADATVIIDGQVMHTGRDGSCLLPAGEEGQVLEVRVAAVGHRPCHSRIRRLRGAEEPILRLGSVPMTLPGRVLDESGSPVVGARVSVLDPTFFGRDLDGSILYAESMALPDEPFPWQSVLTGEDGHFELGGLDDRPYSLVVFDENGLRSTESGPWSPGESQALVTLPPAATRGVKGRLLRVDGQPAAGVALWLERTALEFPYDSPESKELRPIEESVRVRDASGKRVHVIEALNSSLRRSLTTPVRSDENGEFQFPRVPVRGEVFLRAWGPGWVDLEQRLEPGSPRVELRILGERRFQIRRDEESLSFDRYHVVDRDGVRRQLGRSDGDVTMLLRSGSFEGSCSEVYCVPEDAHELVLEKDGVEVGRLPLLLERDEVILLRP